MNNFVAGRVRRGSLVLLSMLGMLAIHQSANGQTIVPPFTGYLPGPVGNNTSPAVLITFSGTAATGYSTAILKDVTFGPYDGSDDTLVAVLNTSDTSLFSLHLTSSTDIFGFDGDGLATLNGGHSFGPTGYEGPSTSFSNFSSADSFRSGDVNFIGGLAGGGGHTYISLEENLTSATGPQVVITGPPVTGSSAVPEPSTYGLFGAAALMGVVLFRRRTAKR